MPLRPGSAPPGRVAHPPPAASASAGAAAAGAARIPARGPPREVALPTTKRCLLPLVPHWRMSIWAREPISAFTGTESAREAAQRRDTALRRARRNSRPRATSRMEAAPLRERHCLLFAQPAPDGGRIGAESPHAGNLRFMEPRAVPVERRPRRDDAARSPTGGTGLLHPQERADARQVWKGAPRRPTSQEKRAPSSVTGALGSGHKPKHAWRAGTPRVKETGKPDANIGGCPCVPLGMHQRRKNQGHWCQWNVCRKRARCDIAERSLPEIPMYLGEQAPHLRCSRQDSPWSKSAKFGCCLPMLASIGQVRANVGRCSVNSTNIWPNFGSRGNFSTTCAQDLNNSGARWVPRG